MKPNIPRRRPPQRCSTNDCNDRLSNLPDEILCHILSFLPTKNAVTTSILSSRYFSLWSCIPVLNFHYQPHLHSPQKFVEFVNKVLAGNRSPSINTFKLSFKNCTDLELISTVNHLIKVVIKRSIVKMELSVFANHVVKGDECFGEFWFKFVALEPDGSVLGALLGACKVHGAIELGNEVARRLLHMQPQHSGQYASKQRKIVDCALWQAKISAILI
ncbi:hypothetical protein RJ639_019945 [Escallonia herrerae]|uniref:F-box domain-containing protein n=1 Tax=Escallonia herrerae TaxID=1293975 RepID=A0AA88V9Y0_9ASTE|nr:hypothetical protein RJ639_019945 [Escallonia herrerae]